MYYRVVHEAPNASFSKVFHEPADALRFALSDLWFNFRAKVKVERWSTVAPDYDPDLVDSLSVAEFEATLASG